MSIFYVDKATIKVVGVFRKDEEREYSLRSPLLSDVEKGESRESETAEPEIKENSEYNAGWTDLLKICLPDLHLIIFAFIMLTLAAVAQVYIPRFTGNILDALGAEGGGDTFDGSVWEVEGFKENVRNLAIAAVACGFFSGARGR